MNLLRLLLTGCITTATFKNRFAGTLLLLLLWMLPAPVQAQFEFVTNDGAITITEYTVGPAVIFSGTPTDTLNNASANASTRDGLSARARVTHGDVPLGISLRRTKGKVAQN